MRQGSTHTRWAIFGEHRGIEDGVHPALARHRREDHPARRAQPVRGEQREGDLCGICGKRYLNMAAHLRSRQHQAKMNGIL